MDSAHSSWRHDKRETNGYRNSEKDRQISVSSSPTKKKIRHKDRILSEKSLCRWCVSSLYTVDGNRKEMRLSTQIHTRTDRSQSHPLQKNIVAPDRILCKKSVCMWCGFCIQLMATGGERCDCLHKF